MSCLLRTRVGPQWDGVQCLVPNQILSAKLHKWWPFVVHCDVWWHPCSGCCWANDGLGLPSALDGERQPVPHCRATLPFSVLEGRLSAGSQRLYLQHTFP